MIIGPVAERYLECLNGEFQLPENGINIPDIIPNITVNDGIILPLQNSPLKTIVIQVVLMVSETAQTHIVPDLGRLVSEFDQSLVQL